jgi:hypothetical protein
MKTFQQFITKKIYDAAKLVGSKTIQCNIKELSTILGQARQVPGGKKWTFSKTASKELANLTCCRRALPESDCAGSGEWFQCRRLELPAVFPGYFPLE